jgi:hypothetical protein
MSSVTFDASVVQELGEPFQEFILRMSQTGWQGLVLWYECSYVRQSLFLPCRRNRLIVTKDLSINKAFFSSRQQSLDIWGSIKLVM